MDHNMASQRICDPVTTYSVDTTESWKHLTKWSWSSHYHTQCWFHHYRQKRRMQKKNRKYFETINWQWEGNDKLSMYEIHSWASNKVRKRWHGGTLQTNVQIYLHLGWKWKTTKKHIYRKSRIHVITCQFHQKTTSVWLVYLGDYPAFSWVF